MNKDKRPILREIPIGKAKGKLFSTMSIGQWDGFLQTIYDNGGALLELNNDEELIKVYQKEEAKGK